MAAGRPTSSLGASIALGGGGGGAAQGLRRTENLIHNHLKPQKEDV
jgi:hypothetical protein